MTDKKATPACWAWPEPDRAQIQEALAGEGPQWTLMREWHGGRCAICGKRPPWLVEDHDHDTALTRGFLCSQCNVQEGYRFGGAVAMYRECNPAVILGFRIVYVDRMTGLAAVPKRVLTPEERERRDEVVRAALDKAFAARG